MIQNMGIAWRLTLCITVGAAIVMGLILGGSYYFIEDTLAENLAQYVKSMAEDAAEQTGDYLEEVEKSNKLLAANIEKELEQDPGGDFKTQEHIVSLLKEQLSSSDIVFGVCVAYEPAVEGDAKTAPDFTYVYYDQEKIDVLQEKPYSASFIERNNTGLYERQWYGFAKKTGRSLWTEPYSYTEHDGDATLLITYSTPLFKSGDTEKLIGVVGTDVSLKWFFGGLGSWVLKHLSYTFIMLPDGTFLVNTSEKLGNHKTIHSFVEAHQNELLTATVKNMPEQKAGFVEIPNLINNEAAWFIYLPIKESGWTLGVFFPKHMLIEIAGKLLWLQLVLGGGGFVLLILVIWLLVRNITGPLIKLNKSVRKISQDLDAPLPNFPGSDEVAVLAHSYKAMVGELKVNMKRLAETSAAKAKIESELRIARSIQMSLVPKSISSFGRGKFDIYAVLEPAKEVGGDFYDFFMLDDEHLCLVIGDVSGKGIPAAIFMAVVRTLMQAFSKNINRPGELLHAINSELAKENESCMFVTLFCAVVHLPTGNCRYANGGHNPPFVIERNGLEKDNIFKLPPAKGPLVGAMENAVFNEGEFLFKPGSTLFLYTDGITEAENDALDFYGENKLIEVLSDFQNCCCQEIGKAVRRDVAAFAENQEQSDDITLIVFDYGTVNK